MKGILAMIVAALLASFTTAALATENGTAVEAEALVKKAITHYKKVGREKALADFQKNPGPFVDRDLYVTVYDLEGHALSHINARMVGKNLIDLRDPDGVYLIRERLEAARKSPSGWQDYKFFNPVSKKVEPKRMFWEKYDDIVFAAGAYKKS
jgi:hypothetical protein